MPLVESTIRNGTLTFTPFLGTEKDFSCQVLGFRCTPTHRKGDQVETLCGDLTSADTTTTWVAKGKIVSDFSKEATASIVRWTHTNHLAVASFEFTPDDASGTDIITGAVRVLALELGGDVAKRIELEFEWDMAAAPEYTPVT